MFDEPWTVIGGESASLVLLSLIEIVLAWVTCQCKLENDMVIDLQRRSCSQIFVPGIWRALHIRYDLNLVKSSEYTRINLVSALTEEPLASEAFRVRQP